MKKKLTRIWGVGLVVVMISTLLLSAAPMSAGQLSFGSETIPTSTGNVVLDGVDITDMAVGGDGTTIWVADTANATLYKSTDGGQTFSTKTPPGGIVPELIAIAPDDSDIVVVGGNTTLAYVTIDGGSNWGTLGTIIETGGTTLAAMNDIAISPDDSGTHYIAIAGNEDSTTANIWYFDLGDTTPEWKETNVLTDFGDGVVPDDAFAVAFSPNFASDKVMVVLTRDNDGTPQVDFEIFSFSTKVWNDFAGFTSYPVEVKGGSVTSASGDIALTPDYLGSDDSMRIAFVGLDHSTAASDGIYRLTDTSVKEVSLTKDIFSIAYDGTNLVAGQAGGNAVYRSADPLASSPTVSTTSTLKRPGGTGNVTVAWAGADVFAGTIGNSSSFNISRDNGKSFNGLSLVDSSLTLVDVAISADASVKYLSFDDGTGMSLWRDAGGWERVLNVTGTAYIVRIAPEDPNTVYVADLTTQTMYYSSEGGDTKFFVRSSRYPIADIAVESADVVYVARDGAATVSKSTNAGFTWGSAKGTGLTGGNINMIQSLSEDNLLVGSTTGYVAWSTDGNSNWSKSTKQINDSSNPVQVTASGLADGDFIYAGTEAADLDIDRWEIGSSTGWSDIMSGTQGDGMSVRGLLLDSNGAAYAVSDNGTNSQVRRALSPSSADDSTTWSTMSSAGETFAAVPSALRITEGSTKLWFINTAANTLFSYTDDMVAAGPTLSGPRDGVEIAVNPVSGGTFTVPLSWERLSKATSYNVQVSLDSSFTEKILTPTVASTSGTVSSVQAGEYLMPDTTYYWRVRVASDGPIYSPWSATRSFSIGSLPDVAAPIVIEAPTPAPAPEIVIEAPIITIQPPEIVIPPAPAPAPAPEIVIPAAPAAPAPITPGFIWAIVIIGAILIIALIILIIRTRRPI